jgi:phosphonate transport system ATP-binding protein
MIRCEKFLVFNEATIGAGVNPVCVNHDRVGPVFSLFESNKKGGFFSMIQTLDVPLLELKHVTKNYNGTTLALDDISFSVAEGEFVSIIGPSGAGKSTLLRCINRMIEPSGGEISFDGVVTSKLGKSELRKLRTKIGMIFQHYNLVDRLTVIENVLHGRLGYKSTLEGVLGRYSRDEKKQACRIINLLGLDEQIYQRCDRLSGGQKQRVGIGRALIQNPKLILCDEPIASLDPSAAKIIMDHLRNVSTQMGITIIVNLHQVDVAMKYADRIIGVNKGKIVFDGSPDELTSERIADIYGTESKELIADFGERYAS